MLLIILLAIFGLAALRQGEFKITRDRKVDGSIGRSLGVLMLVGAGLSMLVIDWAGLVSLLLAIIIGLVASKPIGV